MTSILTYTRDSVTGALSGFTGYPIAFTHPAISAALVGSRLYEYNPSTNQIDVFDLGDGSAAPLLLTSVPTPGIFPLGSTGDDGSVLYGSTNGEPPFVVAKVDTNGIIGTPAGLNEITGFAPVFNSHAGYLYVYDNSLNKVFAYSFDATGAPTLVNSISVTAPVAGFFTDAGEPFFLDTVSGSDDSINGAYWMRTNADGSINDFVTVNFPPSIGNTTWVALKDNFLVTISSIFSNRDQFNMGSVTAGELTLTHQSALLGGLCTTIRGTTDGNTYLCVGGGFLSFLTASQTGWNSSNIMQFSTPLTPNNIDFVAMSATGVFALLYDQPGETNIAAGSRDTNGDLSLFAGTSTTISPTAQWIALSPDCKRLYVADPGDPQGLNGPPTPSLVWIYDIDSTTGQLTPAVPALVPAQDGANFIALDECGKYAYVANFMNTPTPPI